MTSAQAAVAPKRPTRPFRPFAQPAPEPDDIVSCFTGQNGLELVVEMAHDIRSPLTSILFLVEALHQGQAGPVTESQRRSLGLIYSAALGLCTSASDVVELARGSHRLADPEPSPFSVSEVFTSVRNMILPIAREQGLDVRLVHPVPERRIGHTRPLSRVLLNLATNAAKYTERGWIEIAARPLSATRLEFAVADTGSGIDPDMLQTLYQPFRKVDGDPRHRFSSTGLGLAICRKLVRAMGTELAVETSSEGTRFSFALEVPPAGSRS